MYSPPLSEFLWSATAAVPGSAPWPLMLWFESAASPPPAAVLSIPPVNQVVSRERPGNVARGRQPNLSRFSR